MMVSLFLSGRVRLKRYDIVYQTIMSVCSEYLLLHAAVRFTFLQAYCNFTIFVGVVMFVISATQIYRLSYFLYKGKDSSFFSAFVDVLSSVFMCSMTLTAALFITLGFSDWCSAMTKRFDYCADATENDIGRNHFLSETERIADISRPGGWG